MTINVCFATNDHYAPHAAALIVSIMENKLPEDELSFHFFSDKTSPLIQKTFCQMSREIGFRLAIYEMSGERFDNFPEYFGNRTIYFRLSMHRMLPDSIKKILYLDCDMIVMSSLKELYSTDISDHYAAVVAEMLRRHLPLKGAYFNSGMILFNLEKYRDENLEEQALQFACEHPEWLHCPDQDTLNYIFKGNVVYSPLKWNMMYDEGTAEYIASKGYGMPYSKEEVREAESNPGIVHYTTVKKPWTASCRHPHQASYWKYARQTPFYESVLLKMLSDKVPVKDINKNHEQEIKRCKRKVKQYRMLQALTLGLVKSFHRKKRHYRNRIKQLAVM